LKTPNTSYYNDDGKNYIKHKYKFEILNLKLRIFEFEI
jgi:hypothetical protein